MFDYMNNTWSVELVERVNGDVVVDTSSNNISPGKKGLNKRMNQYIINDKLHLNMNMQVCKLIML